MEEEERKLRESIMDCLAISGEYDAEWTNGYIDIGPGTIMSVVNDLVELIRKREPQTRPGYKVGQRIRGFDFSMGEERQGRVVEIKCYVVFGYVLDTGHELGPYDDVYTRERGQASEGT